MPIPAIIMVFGGLALGIHVARRDNLGIKDALLTLIGMRDFEKSPRLKTFILATFVLTLGLWFILFERCQAGL